MESRLLLKSFSSLFFQDTRMSDSDVKSTASNDTFQSILLTIRVANNVVSSRSLKPR